MKYILSFLIALSISAASFGQKVTTTPEGYIKVIPDTVKIQVPIIVIKDTTIYVDKIVYVDRPVIVYKDTCGGKDTVVIPPDPSKVAYLSLPISTPLDLSGQSNKIIENIRIVNAPGVAIKLGNARNITIRNVFIDGAGAEAIEMEGATNITIENNLITKATSGVYALSSQNVKVNNNQFVNVRQRIINGQIAGRGQFVQFNGVGGTGNEVRNNKGENFADESDPEDCVSLFNTSNVIVSGNTFRGGVSQKKKVIQVAPNQFREVPVSSESGSGIMSGDHDGTNQLIENNTIINTGNVGIGVAGGTNIRVLNNKIYSERNLVSNNPLYVADYSPGVCSNITVRGNRVTWTDKNGSKNNGWNSGDCSNTVYEPNTPITLAEMNVPNHLIDFVTPAELLKIRGK